MSSDDEYRTWLETKRRESPPADLTNRIMSAVREPEIPGTASRSTDTSSKTVWQRVLPYLVCSAAALVLAVRLYSVVILFVEASPIADVAMIELEKELTHEP